MGIITTPKLGQHIIFCGTTGSGKTYLAERMIAEYDKTFIFDTHDSLKIPGSHTLKTPEMLETKLRLFKKIKYVPKLEYRTKIWYNYVIKLLMTKSVSKGRVIYVDEIFHLGFGQSFPDWLSRGISTARQRKQSFWISSQRPSNIPMAILTEATKIYCFYLSYEDDIEKLSKFVRDKKNFEKEMKDLKYDFSFIEIDRIKGEWKKLPKLKGDDLKNGNKSA